MMHLRTRSLLVTTLIIGVTFSMPVDGQPSKTAESDGTAVNEATDEFASYIPAVWTSPDEGKLNYLCRSPQKLQPTKTYPLVLFLHGAGGRGDDNRQQLADAGAVQSLAKQKLFGGQGSANDCFLLAGQVPEEQKWVDVPWESLDHEMPAISDSMRMMLECMDAFVADPENQIDPKRIYVIGLSMGGYGTWDAIQRRPETFAAAVPICGGGDKRLANRLVDLPIWAWHGERDDVVSVSRSRDMVEAIRAKSAGESKRLKYTEVAGRTHDVWVPALQSTDMWDWLFQQQRE